MKGRLRSTQAGGFSWHCALLGFHDFYCVICGQDWDNSSMEENLKRVEWMNPFRNVIKQLRSSITEVSSLYSPCSVDFVYSGCKQSSLSKWKLKPRKIDEVMWVTGHNDMGKRGARLHLTSLCPAWITKGSPLLPSWIENKSSFKYSFWIKVIITVRPHRSWRMLGVYDPRLLE